jgi:hypothetical protein
MEKDGSQQGEVVVTIAVVDEDGSTIYPSLGDVKRDAGEFETRAAWHEVVVNMEVLPMVIAAHSLMKQRPSRFFVRLHPWI